MHVDESDARPLRTQAGLRSTAGRDLNTALESQRTRHGSDLPLHANVLSHLRSHCGTNGSPRKPQNVSYLSTVTKGSQGSSQQCDLHGGRLPTQFGKRLWLSLIFYEFPAWLSLLCQYLRTLYFSSVAFNAIPIKY